MVERQSGEKSVLRIAKSSIEQVGYERHRTRSVPVSARALKAPGRRLAGGDKKIRKTGFGFKGAGKIFWRVSGACASWSSAYRQSSPGNGGPRRPVTKSPSTFPSGRCLVVAYRDAHVRASPTQTFQYARSWRLNACSF